MMVDVVENSGHSQIESLLKVYTGILRMRRIIDDMLDVSLIDNNLLTLNFQPLCISQFIKSFEK